MKMKRNTDWTDVMRSTLRDAEIPPSEKGWERLQRELEGVEPRLAGALVPEPRKNVWRIYGPRIAAAAAVVLVCVVTGEFLWRSGPELENGQPVIASMTEADNPSAAVSRLPESETLQQRLAEASGWPSETVVDPGTSGKHAELLALAADPVSGTDDSDAARSAGSETVGRKVASTAVPQPGNPQESLDTTSDPALRSLSTDAALPESHDTPKSRASESSRNRTASAEKWSSDPFFDERIGFRQPRTKASLALFAGGGMTGGSGLQGAATRSYAVLASDAVSLVGNGDNFSPMVRRKYDESSFRHHLPLGGGVSVRAEFPYGLSLESGVCYTLLRSDVRLQYSSEDVSQKLHFIGVPLRLNWQFVEQGRFSAYLGAGGMLEKCISAKFGSETVDESELQWSATAAIGAQYRLGNFVGLYFEPEAAYYFTDTELRTSRSDAPLSLLLRVGVRLLF